MITYQISTLRDLESFAQQLLADLESNSRSESQATVLAITGDLGAGKTTFVQLLAKTLGVTEVVTSPTFTIMKGYEIARDGTYKRLVHMDAYRIETEDELGPLRLGEILQTPNTLVCIEWAERIKDVLPLDTWQLVFTASGESAREVAVTRPHY